MTRAQIFRQALVGLPDGTSHGEADLPVANVYLPRSHLKAMDPDASVVVGMRGAGKTFWWKALQDKNVRLLVGKNQHSRLTDTTEVKLGFGVRAAPEDYPSKDVLANLLTDDVDPRLVWRTVLARHLSPSDDPLRQLGNWRKRCDYTRQHAEEIDVLLHQQDSILDQNETYLLILFDALDRCADGWQNMYRLIRGLMQIASDMRSYKRIRVKAFLRTDQVEETRIRDFPDASKILSSRAELNWPPNELYGLLWHLLANGPKGEDMRSMLTKPPLQGLQSLLIDENDENWEPLKLQEKTVFAVPRQLVFSERDQRDAFHNIAGPWMGRDRRRGFPYTWIPNHLADTEGKVSPRSFLAAMKTAAINTEERHPKHEHALHFDSIKLGVQEASKIRVDEFREDYPWVHRMLTALEGMVVPCSFEEIEQRWQERDVFSQLRNDTSQDAVKSRLRQIERGAQGVREELETLSIFQRLLDGRVNIPDVFRVGYGLGRRGGVKPVRG